MAEESPKLVRQVAHKVSCPQCHERYFTDQVNDDGVCAFCLVLRPDGRQPDRPRYTFEEVEP